MSTIGGNMGLGKANMEQALRAMRERSQELQGGAAGQAKPASFTASISENVAELSKVAQSTETIALEAVQGELEFHEVAGRIKEAQLSFDFAMQVRNKLIDSYREIMRMSV